MEKASNPGGRTIVQNDSFLVIMECLVNDDCKIKVLKPVDFHPPTQVIIIQYSTVLRFHALLLLTTILSITSILLSRANSGVGGWGCFASTASDWWRTV